MLIAFNDQNTIFLTNTPTKLFSAKIEITSINDSHLSVESLSVQLSQSIPCLPHQQCLESCQCIRTKTIIAINEQLKVSRNALRNTTITYRWKSCSMICVPKTKQCMPAILNLYTVQIILKFFTRTYSLGYLPTSLNILLSWICYVPVSNFFPNRVLRPCTPEMGN